jgi:phage/plasmid-like protein (TIGR03299 family)
MAHEMTDTDRFGHHGDAAWHGLGERLPAHVNSATEALKHLGLDWRMIQRPIQAVWEDLSTTPVKGWNAHVREDTGETLAIIANGYQTLQNVGEDGLSGICDSLQTAIRQTLGADARIETAFSIRGGRKVITVLKLPHLIEITKGDLIHPYLTVSNGHDPRQPGGGGGRAYGTAIREVCANTNTVSENTYGAGGYRFGHTGDIAAKIEEAKKVLGLITEELETFTDTARTMASTQVTQEAVDAYFTTVYEATFGRPSTSGALVQNDAVEKALSEAMEAYEKRQTEITEAWQSNLVGAGQTGPTSLWTAYNAVTEYHDHQRGRGEIQNRTMTPARTHSNLFGASARDKATALRIAKTLI